MKHTEELSIYTILFHWMVVASYVGLVGLGFYMVTLGYYDPNYTRLPELHKSIGMLMLAALTVHIAWRTIKGGLPPLATHRVWEVRGSKMMHWLLRIGTMLVLISGYLIATADGSGVSVFEWFMVPASMTEIANQEDVAGEVHYYAAYIVLAFACLHAGAAIKHHLVDRDTTLIRMIGLKRAQTKRKEL